MKKKLSLVLAMAVLILSVTAGCGGGGSGSGGDSGDSGNSGQPEYTIRVAHVLATDHATNITAEEVFKKEVEEKSGGRIKVEVYPNGQLGGDRQTIEALQLGTLEMCIPGGTVLSGFVEDFMVLDLPFLFPSKDAAFKVFDGEVGDELNKKLDGIGIVNLGYGENGYRHVTNNKGPVTSPADLKGVKIRTMENPIHMATFKAFGANPTPISFNELFTALQQKTIDAQENPIPIIFTSKLYEVQKYLTLTGHVYTQCPYLISKSFFETLPEDLQKVVRDAAADCIKEQRIQCNNQEQEYVQSLKDNGMEINELTGEQRQAFVDAVQPVYDDYVKQYGGDMLTKIQDEIKGM